MDIIRLIYYFISLSSKKEQENVFYEEIIKIAIKTVKNSFKTMTAFEVNVILFSFESSQAWKPK